MGDLWVRMPKCGNEIRPVFCTMQRLSDCLEVVKAKKRMVSSDEVEEASDGEQVKLLMLGGRKKKRKG